jgi:hypothetical protein
VLSEPPPAVVAAFGAAGARPVALGGGQGISWVARDVVLKPAELDQEELEWQAQIYSQIPWAGFRLARPRLAADGSWCVDGWCATEYVTGRHEERRWAEIIAVGQRFHAVLRGIPRPSFLDQRSSPWAISDRVAWGEIPASEFPRVGHLLQLVSALRPVTAPSQLIHGGPHRQRPVRRPAAASYNRLLALLAANCLRISNSDRRRPGLGRRRQPGPGRRQPHR